MIHPSSNDSKYTPKLLVVDDQHDGRLLVTTTLKKMNLEIHHAENGVEALEKIAQHHFFLIILDINMPGMNGFEVARNITSDSKLNAKSMIIFMTAFATRAEDIKKGFKAGAVDFLFKPIFPDILRGKVKVFQALHTRNRIIEEQTLQLEEANRHLNEFSYTVAHDLKSPLCTMSSMLELLSEKNCAGEGEDDAQVLLSRLKNTCYRSTRLVEDLLSFSGSHELDKVEQVDLNEVMHNVIMDLGNTIKELGAQIHIESLPIILGCNSQMHQVFANLLSNGLKFTRKGVAPIIKIYSQIITRSMEESEEELNICKIFVEDNGIGIEEGQKGDVFKPFNRLHSVSEYEGSGIGLATVKKIVAYHCGSVMVADRQDQKEGCSFILTLPLNLSDDAIPFIRKEIRVKSAQGKIVQSNLLNVSKDKCELEVVDESDHGLCCQASHTMDLNIGDVILVENQRKYEIRWLKNENEKIQLGLKLLS
ncbi:MAG: response regulator [Planctomycetes bacterium]|nr:response regulator [Planctomycetota bacterium]